jgi:TetR/AcrR family transcriptional regulator, regulator of cefoperazone and chloramphenicol sensitivity
MFSLLNVRSADMTATARIRDAAIEQWGQRGFDVGLRAVAEAAGVSAALVIHHFGSKEALRKACDDYITEEIRDAKTESLTTADPATWFAEIAEIESYAPIMRYLVRSMQSGSELAKEFWRRMLENAEEYLEEGVRAGTLKPSRDPRARAKYLGLTSGGGFLLFLQMHDNPTDMAAVLHDYGEEMVLPALEVMTEGLMSDSTMYEAFLAQQEARQESANARSKTSSATKRGESK